MITKEQTARAEREFASDAMTWGRKARDAERSLDGFVETAPRDDLWTRRHIKLVEEFEDADYMAESRAWILQLIRDALATQR